MTPLVAEAPSLVAFDVNHTLLDLGPLRAEIQEVLGDAAVFEEWLGRLLHGSLVANHLKAYRTFEDIGVEALLAVAAGHGVSLKGEQAEGLVAGMARLPAHPEVYNALERLFDRDVVMVALTNASTAVANAQVENAGLHPFLRRVISVEEVRRFKPAPEPYHHTALAMGVPLEEMILVAAHDWDCAGAMAVGAQAAFVKRRGAVWSLPTPPPARIYEDLANLAEGILAEL